MHTAVIQNALRLTIDQRLSGQTLEAILLQQLLLPDAFVRELFSTGRVQVGTQSAVAVQTVRASQQVWLRGGVHEPEPLVDARAVASTQLEVLYEDDHALVVNKPAGLLVYPGTEADTDTLAHRVAAHYLYTGQRCRVRHVHRLDRETTGATLYAKHEYAARTFDVLLRDHRIKRQYLAVVQGKLPRRTGTVELSIGRDRHVSGRYRVSSTGKAAKTRYQVVEQRSHDSLVFSLVECILETGRTHQIRVHLAALGCPVVGDAVYGQTAFGEPAAVRAGAAPVRSRGQALHAWRLAFWNPYEERQVEVAAPPDQALLSLLTACDLSAAWKRVFATEGADGL